MSTGVQKLYAVYGKISPIFRRKRLQWFEQGVSPRPGSDRMLDIGGYPYNWADMPPMAKELQIINIDDLELDEEFARKYGAQYLVGDACDLPFADNDFDIVFSNSVIEHVGTWENQQRFAAEARRTGDALWVQTPARGFFIETHYIAPFIHWFPINVQRRLARWFTVWGLLVRPTPEEIEARLQEIRLLTYKEMVELFPDCEILRERFLKLFTKSYVALRPRKTSPLA